MQTPEKDKELALSTLIRRDRDDPGAVRLLDELLKSSSFRIRKRAIAVADRFLHQKGTPRILKRTALQVDELPLIRNRALQTLESLFDPGTSLARDPNYRIKGLTSLKESLFSLVTARGHILTVRARALEVASFFVSGRPLRKWILYFHNQEAKACRLSALRAMGRVDEHIWDNYIEGYIDGGRMEFHFAALESISSPPPVT